MKLEKVKLSKVRKNKDNPRTITPTKLQKLVTSILVLPKMLELRPVVVDETNTALGGNMRVSALAEIDKMDMEAVQENLKSSIDYSNMSSEEQQVALHFWQEWKEAPYVYIVHADGFTEAEKEQFIIKDNVSFGTWDWDELADKWDSAKLNDWGLDVWQTPDDVESVDNIDAFFDEVKNIEPKEEKEVCVTIHIPIEEKDIQDDIRSIVKDALTAYPNVSVR